jgi:hypothetical protein
MSASKDYYDDLVDAEYIDDFKIKCTFKDGKQGIVDMSHYYKKGGVFSRPFILIMVFYHGIKVK